MASQGFWEKSRTHQFLAAVLRFFVPSSLRATNAPVDGYVPSKATGEDLFTWIAPGGGGGGQVDSIVEGDGIDVDATDPVNPTVSVFLSADMGNTLSFGTDDGLLNTGGGSTINAPFGFGAGSKGGAPIPVNNADAGGVAAYQYTLGNWYMEVYPTISSGTFTVDIRRAASGAYPPVSSICAGSAPTITTGNEASGNSAGFSSNVIDPVDAVDAVVTVNTAGVQWWRLVFEAVRPI